MMFILLLTCFYFHLNVKCFSIQSSALGFRKRLFPGVAPDGTNLCDGFLNRKHFMCRKVHVTAGAGAVTFDNKCSWISVLVHHTALQPEEKNIRKKQELEFSANIKGK